MNIHAWQLLWSVTVAQSGAGSVLLEYIACVIVIIIIIHVHYFHLCYFVKNY